jgi:PhnB protein
MAKASFKPEGYNTIIASLAFRNTEAAIDWYKKIFNAKERATFKGPDQKVMHTELTIGDSVIFMAEENPKYGSEGPQVTNGNSVKLHFYVEDVDEQVEKAVQHGASVTMAAMDMFYGDRVACIDDPFGYSWVLSTHFKDVSEKEMKEKAESFVGA